MAALNTPPRSTTSRPLSLALPSGPASSAGNNNRPTLDDVLANVAPPPYTLTAFMAYLSQNHCLETLEFTMDAKRYRESYQAVSRQLRESPVVTDCPQTQHLRNLFQRLLTAYIVPAAPREINVTSEVRDNLLSHSHPKMPPPPETLNAAVKRMHALMDESIFLPFLNSQSPTTLVSGTSHPDPGSTKSGLQDSQLARHVSIRRRLSPQSSFASPRPPATTYYAPQYSMTSNSPMSNKPPISRTSGYTSTGSSGDTTGSGNLTDDTGSTASSPGAGEPMTPPTTPPSNDLSLAPSSQPPHLLQQSRPQLQHQQQFQQQQLQSPLPHPSQSGPGGGPPVGSKTRSDNAWKKMGLKFSWKKRSATSASAASARDPRFPATEE